MVFLNLNETVILKLKSIIFRIYDFLPKGGSTVVKACATGAIVPFQIAPVHLRSSFFPMERCNFEFKFFCLIRIPNNLTAEHCSKDEPAILT